MISAILGLLLIQAPVHSYLKSSLRDRSRCFSQLIDPPSKYQAFFSKVRIRTELRDHESIESVNISPPIVYEGLNTSAQNSERNDNVKERMLLSKDWETPNKLLDIRCYLSVNESFVPVIGVHKTSTFIKLRSYLFSLGVYPGVEYKVLNISIINDAKNSGATRQVATLQGLLQRGLKSNDNKEDSTWLKRLFSGQTQLIQTGSGSSDSSSIIDINENVCATLETYQEEEDFIELTVRPAYPLIRTLEKKWPVKVRLSSMPYVFSRGAYTTVTLLGTLSFALSYFLGALLLTQVFTFSFVNSRSMTPTILPGDLILVEKVSPIIRRALHILPASKGDVVFFSAPPRLLQYIEESNIPVPASESGSSAQGKNKVTADRTKAKAFEEGFLAAQQGISTESSTETASVTKAVVEDRNPFHYRNLRPIRSNSLLVKRLQKISYPAVRETGVLKSGKELTPERSEVQGVKRGPACLTVLGDNPEVSLDSRQWGCLDEELVVGRPVLRVLPLKRFGFI